MLGVRDLVFDHVRNQLYMSTSAGAIERFDVQSQSLLAPIPLGVALNGLDITPDAKALYVTGAKGAIKKVNLATNSVESLPFASVGSESGTFDIAIANNGKALFDSSYDGSGPVPLREIDLATDTLSVRNDNFSQDAIISRGADRSLFFFPGSNSNGPMRTYTSATDTLSPTTDANAHLRGRAEVNRNGMLIACQFGSAIAVFDSKYKVVENFPNMEGGFGFSPVEDIFVVADTTNHSLIAYDTKTWSEKYRILAGEALGAADIIGVGAMTFSSDGRHIYLAQSTGVLHFLLPDATGNAGSLSVEDVSRFLALGSASTSVTVSARDPAGNIAAGYRGTVHFSVPTDSGVTLPVDYTFTAADAGVHTFTVWLATAGVHTLTVADAANGLAKSVTGIEVYAPSSRNLLPISDARDLVFDATRNRLYVSTTAGTIERFDATSGALLAPLSIAKSPLDGLDISSDGTTLLAAEGQRSVVQSSLRKVDLGTSASTIVGYDLKGSDGPANDVVYAANGLALFDAKQQGTGGTINLRSFNSADGSIDVIGRVAARDAVMARGENRSRLFFLGTETSSGPMLTYDSATRTLSPERASIAFARGPVAVNRTGALLARELGTNVAIFDANYRIVENLPNMAGGIAFSPVDDLFVAADVTNNVLVAYDTTNWKEKYRIVAAGNLGVTSSGLGIGTMAFSSDGKRLFQIQSAGVYQYNLPQPTGVASSITVEGISNYLGRGVTSAFTVSVKDPAGNIASGYRGTVHFSVPTDSGASLPMDYTFNASDAGVHTFSVSFRTVGTHNMLLTDAANSLAKSIPGIQVHAAGDLSLIPVGNARDLIFDRFRNRLYATTAAGTVERFDLETGSLMAPIVAAKTPLSGGDITLDGRYLIVAEGQRSAVQGSLRKIDLETGVVTLVRYDLVGSEGAAFDVGIAANGLALFDGESEGAGRVNLRSLEPTDEIIGDIGLVGPRSQLAVSNDRERVFVLGINLTTDLYTANTGGFSRRVDGGSTVAGPLAATNRDGSLFAYKHSQTIVRRGDDSATVVQSITPRGGVVFDPNADILYVADSATNTIFKYDSNAWNQLAAYPIGQTLGNTALLGVGVMAIAADSSRLFLRTSSGIRTYYVGPAPVVTSVTPNQGATTGGTMVTITGSNFLATTGVTFGGVSASFTVNSGTQITVTAPARVVGPVDVVVTNPTGGSAVGVASRYNYVQATPMITWANPASIVYGTALSATQLNASASVPGSFVYSFPIGAVLHAGQNQSITVTFTPNDLARYTTSQKTVFINVTPAPLVIRGNDITVVGSYNFSSLPTATFIGLVNGDKPEAIRNVVVSVQTKPATGFGGLRIPPKSPGKLGPGTYAIIVSGGLTTDYSITYINGTLTVSAS